MTLTAAAVAVQDAAVVGDHSSTRTATAAYKRQLVAKARATTHTAPKGVVAAAVRGRMLANPAAPMKMVGGRSANYLLQTKLHRGELKITSLRPSQRSDLYIILVVENLAYWRRRDNLTTNFKIALPRGMLADSSPTHIWVLLTMTEDATTRNNSSEHRMPRDHQDCSHDRE